MKILYIAYSCNPYAGSEDKIGWNIPFAASSDNEVWVITKEEQRPYVEKFLKETPVKSLHFNFVDIPKIYKKIFKSFLYSGRLNIWHKKVFPIAKKICQDNNIHVIHQITPVEFRAIGKYKNVPNIKFVCGPIGGGEFIPKGLKDYAKGHLVVETIRYLINGFYRICLKFNARLKKCDVVMYANYETRDYLKKVAGKNANSKVVTEIGVNQNDLNNEINNKNHDVITFVSAGRIIYRKGYDFLFDALEQLPKELKYNFLIAGEGEDFNSLCKRIENSDALKSHVKMLGKISYTQMWEFYKLADVFVMPSIRETTGSVILEAMSFGLPVITINRFGGAVILDEQTGWFYDGNTIEEYIESLKNCIIDCIVNYENLSQRQFNAIKKAEIFLWKNKVKYYFELF